MPPPEAPKARGPFKDGILPPLERPERGPFQGFLYPLRGADCLGTIIALAFASWAFLTLVPEICLQFLADAASMGAGLLGLLFALIASVPVVFLGPLVLLYMLQYLGRVLVSSAMGETMPPAAPQRNFEGFLHGTGPWSAWLVLGLGVGLLPAAWFVSSPAIPTMYRWLAFPMALAGLPYMLAALMLSFLHKDQWAARPWYVLPAIVRLGPRFWALCGLIALVLALLLGALALMILLRSRWFWAYVPLALPYWLALHWFNVVVVRLLGTFYFHHRDELRWNPGHPRWGVAWRL